MRWEYKRINLDRGNKDLIDNVWTELDAAGQDGWEAVGQVTPQFTYIDDRDHYVARTAVRPHLLLKRPLPD